MLDTQVLLLMEALDEAQKTYELAQDRYNKGLINLLLNLLMTTSIPQRSQKLL